jgi:hypothetical protein
MAKPRFALSLEKKARLQQMLKSVGMRKQAVPRSGRVLSLKENT